MEQTIAGYGWFIKHIDNALEKEVNQHLQSLNLTMQQHRALVTLVRAENQTLSLKALEEHFGAAQSTVAGLVNTFTYVGSTVATTALPRITGQTSSWALTMLVCAAVALLCLVSSLLLLPRWMRWSKSQEAQE
jgi:sugar phosphate permease